ncbi:antibiotic biosynthesis monooxygenase [Spirillospora sp. NPDC048911]|uniref:antibiotic biosynthesis monooxygenase n=1 Tax=Spirillospora sp. NPDC048911 TaxID=3364527 RepID=UPI00371186A1
MIARVWGAIATEKGADAYRSHFEGEVLPSLRRLNGHRGAYLMERDTEGAVEIEVVTLWESMAAIRAFAGQDVDTAVVEPAAREALTGFDDTVTHFTVVLDTVN